MVNTTRINQNIWRHTRPLIRVRTTHITRSLSQSQTTSVLGVRRMPGIETKQGVNRQSLRVDDHDQ